MLSAIFEPKRFPVGEASLTPTVKFTKPEYSIR